MIRINLLGVPRPKKGKRTGPAMPVLPSEGPNPVLLFVVTIALGATATFYVSHNLDVDSQKIRRDILKEDQDALRLSAIKSRYETRQKEAAEYENRVRVIDELRAAQSGPVSLLDTISTTINNTDAVWLNTMSDGGPQVNVEGVALSANAVANLMTNLAKTGYFKNIEIRETYQDESVRNMQAFNFILVCEKAPQPPPDKTGKS